MFKHSPPQANKKPKPQQVDKLKQQIKAQATLSAPILTFRRTINWKKKWTPFKKMVFGAVNVENKTYS